MLGNGAQEWVEQRGVWGFCRNSASGALRSRRRRHHLVLQGRWTVAGTSRQCSWGLSPLGRSLAGSHSRSRRSASPVLLNQRVRMTAAGREVTAPASQIMSVKARYLADIGW